jgi:hypothetical protein
LDAVYASRHLFWSSLSYSFHLAQPQVIQEQIL